MPLVTRAFNAIYWSSRLKLASTGTAAVTWDDLVVATAWDSLGTVVTTLADEDNGTLGGGAGISLREAVKYSPTGSLITFAPGLSGGTITLTHADGDMFIDRAVTIDATALPGGITVSGNNTSRHFNVDFDKSLTLRGLTLTGGNGGGDGGSINNAGTLTLTQCTLSGNAASSSGGAIYGHGRLTLTHCTLFGNASGEGGAIYSFGSLTLTQCTLSGNAAFFEGGAISNYGSLTLNNSIVAGNNSLSVAGSADIYNRTSVDRVGKNLVQSMVNDPSGNDSGPPAINAAPKLSPLGYFGGPVQTMHPLIGSPAIDAAGTANPGGTDARGFPRFVDGDASGTAQLDIGAVEAGPLLNLVSSAGDSVGLTLRFRLSQVTAPGTRIGFAPALAGQTITLAGTELAAPADKSLFIDASNLTAPVTISGNNQSRVFNIPATATVAMHSLKLTGGSADPDGGGIYNLGTLSLLSSTISGCHARDGIAGGWGGGIYNGGICLLHASTLSGNRGGHSTSGDGGDGGGIYNTGGICTVISSTLHGNSGGSTSDTETVGGLGGGIFNQGTLTLVSSTLSANTAIAGGWGGGILQRGGTCQLQHCLISGNSGKFGSDLHDYGGGFTPVGTNFIGNLQSSGLTASPTLLTGNPLLAPLGDYGGPTQTMALRPGSPARNAATGSARTTDQRGFPIVGTPDIGAYEAGNALLTNYNAFIWETLPATATLEQTAATFDFDGDGQTNQSEWLYGTSVTNPNSRYTVSIGPKVGGLLPITFATALGRTYIVEVSENLITWDAIANYSGTGNVIVADFDTINAPKYFVRIKATLP